MPFNPDQFSQLAGGPAPSTQGFDPSKFSQISTQAPKAFDPQKFAAIARKPKTAHDIAPLRGLEAFSESVAQSPVVRGADAILNAPGRAVTGFIAGMEPNKNPFYSAAHNVMHPGQATEVTHQAEQRLGLQQSQNPWIRAAGDIGFETLTDPVMYVPGLNVIAGAGKLAKLGGRAAEITGLAASPLGKGVSSVVQRARRGAVEGEKLRQGGALRPAEDITKGHEAASDTRRIDAEQHYANLIEQHRPALEAVDARRNELLQQLDEANSLPGEGGAMQRLSREEWGKLHPDIQQARAGRVEQLKGELAQVKSMIPPEVRQATLRRAYREGTPQVRRKVEAAGYVPTAEDRAAPVLNILHRFEDEYEPAQSLFKDVNPEEQAAVEAAGPVRVIRQGNKKASFDLPKNGGDYTAPLADRLLDRFVRGARLEEYHRSRADILRDLGYVPESNLGRTTARIEAAQGAGNAKAAARYIALQKRQEAFEKAAQARREASFAPGTLTGAQKIENLDPETARLRAIREAKLGGAETMGVTPQTAKVATAGLEGRIVGGKRQIRATEKLGDIARTAAERTQRGAQRVAQSYERTLGDLGYKAPSAIKAGIGSVGRGQESLERRIGAAAEQPPVKELMGTIGPSAKAAQEIEGEGAVARARVDTMQQKLGTQKATNQAVDAMRASADQLADAMNQVEMPIALKQRLYGDLKKLDKSIFAAFSDLQRHALFIMPFAHMKNISILAMLGPGSVSTVARGIRNAIGLQRTPAALAAKVKELEQIGATSRYVEQDLRAFEKLPGVGKPLGTIADASASALEKYDIGMRIALMDHLRAQGITGFQAGGQIRDILGDYRNQSDMVQFLRKQLGANFPGWGLGIVPRAMSKAVREQPRAVNTYARANRIASNDITEPTMKTTLDIGGPAEDFAKLAAAPAQFLESPSRLGVPVDLGHALDAERYGRLEDFAGQEAAHMLPFTSTIGGALNWPYPSNAPGLLKAGAGLGGAYFPNIDKKQRAAQLHRLGMKSREVQERLREEGYH